MTDKPLPPRETATGFSLRRWSQRKLDAGRAAQVTSPEVAAGELRAEASPNAVVPAPLAPTVPAEALPPVEELTFDSNFSAFLRPEVDERVKRAALKQLFRDPRFNVMDGLDTYIDDYSKPDPIPPEMFAQLLHGRYIFDPPKTEIGPDGCVVDIPPERCEDTIAEGDADADGVPGVAGTIDAKIEARVDDVPVAVARPVDRNAGARGDDEPMAAAGSIDVKGEGRIDDVPIVVAGPVEAERTEDGGKR